MAGNAREVALLTLSACEKQGAWSDLALKKNIHSVGLDGRDAALATRLCFGVLQNRMLLDFYIGKFSSVRVERMENRVLNALRLVQIADGRPARVPQDTALATYAPMLSRALSPIDWNRDARSLHNQVRGLLPWPAAVAEFGGNRCKVLSTVVIDDKMEKAPGTVIEAGKNGIVMVCGGGTLLRICELQPDGGKRMKAADYLRGHPLSLG